MNQNQIITSAFLEAANGMPDEETLNLVRPEYIRIRDDLFSEKRWLFLLDCLDSSNLIKATEDTRDILLPYKYRFNTNADRIDQVLDVNVQSYVPFGVSEEKALEIGYSVDWERFALEGRRNLRPVFTYIDGVLYSSEPVNNVIVKYKVVETTLESQTRQLLVLRFAMYVALNLKRDKEQHGLVKADFKQQYTKTAYRTVRPGGRPYSDLLYDWYIKYYQGVSY